MNKNISPQWKQISAMSPDMKSINSEKAFAEEVEYVLSAYPETVLPGRWGHFKPSIGPYAKVASLMSTATRQLEEVQTIMADLACRPMEGVPIRGHIYEALDVAKHILNDTARSISSATLHTDKFFKRQVDEGKREIEMHERIKGRRAHASRAWFQVRCWLWKCSYKRQQWNDLLKLHDAYDNVVTNCHLARLAHEEGYKF